MTPSARQPHLATAAVVTVSYGSIKVLPSFLKSVSIASQSPPETVVVDNLLGDNAVRELIESTDARYLPLDRNYGYGGAMNRAVKVLSENVEWILITNPDVVLGAGSLDALVATGSTDPRIGSVGPAIWTDDLLYPSARAVPSIRTGIGHALFANIWMSNPWSRSYRRDAERIPSQRDAGWLSGACLLVRRSAFEELGGFDDGYFMYFEDVDLGYRLSEAGYRNVYEPKASVTHSGAHSTNDRSSQMIAIHHQSAQRFLTRKYAGWSMWPLRTALILGLKVRSAILSRHSTHH